ncbi:hypothetical protein KY285_023435 [Solanum tuberosum]|nr:hypothetical protein KY289_023769 [Solanum tuberosum]KAH0675634.1 hypothetical protein KY285_023435 [Solanum tuberosum]
MVSITAKGREKVVEETPKRKHVTRATNKKFMGDAMKSNKATTEENRRRRKAGNLEIDIPKEGLVVVQNEHSENDTESEDTPLAKIQRRREKQERGKEKGKFRYLSIQGLLLKKRRRLRQQLRRLRENQKKRWRLCLLLKTYQNRDLSTCTEGQGGRVFDPTILKKPGMKLVGGSSGDSIMDAPVHD